MANNYTGFSFVAAEKVTPEEETWLKEHTDDEKIEEAEFPYPFQDECVGFNLEVTDDREAIFYHDESGDVGQVANFVQLFLREHRPQHHVVIEFSHWCDKARVDNFAGGAVLVTAEKQHWINPGNVLQDFQEKNGDMSLTNVIHTFDYEDPE